MDEGEAEGGEVNPFSEGVASALEANGGPNLNKAYRLLILTAARRVVRHERILRELPAASTIQVWKASDKHPLSAPLKDLYKDCMTAVKEQGKEHKLGAPQGPLSLKLLNLLTEAQGNAKYSKEQEAAVLEYKENFMQMEVEQMMTEVLIVKVQKAYSAKGKPKMITVKLCIYSPQLVKSAIGTWLSSAGPTRLTGTPAAASTERDLVKLLGKIEETEK